jgi:hypothetical protein
VPSDLAEGDFSALEQSPDGAGLVEWECRLPVPSRALQRSWPGSWAAQERLPPRGPRLEHLPALHLLLTRAEPPQARRRRTRRGVDVPSVLSQQDAVRFFREGRIALVFDQTTETLQADSGETVKTSLRKAS